MNRIFVIEDEAIMRDLLTMLLDRTPDLMVAGSAATGKEALEVWSSEDVDLTLLDLTLPDISGLDVLQEFRRRAPDCRVLILSGHHRSEARESARLAGAAGFILKGDPADIIKGIRDALEDKPPSSRPVAH